MKKIKYILLELLISLARQFKYFLCVILTAIFMLIIAGYNNGKINFDLFSVWYIPVLALVFIAILLAAIYREKIFSRQLLFSEDEILVIAKLFKYKIIYKKFAYNTITKIIIGRYYNSFDPEGNLYSFYVDIDDRIKKIFSIKTYKNCLDIIDEIHKKTAIKIYDDTDTYYMREDDLFRSYYKLKRTVDEIKNM